MTISGDLHTQNPLLCHTKSFFVPQNRLLYHTKPTFVPQNRLLCHKNPLLCHKIHFCATQNQLMYHKNPFCDTKPTFVTHKINLVLCAFLCGFFYSDIDCWFLSSLLAVLHYGWSALYHWVGVKLYVEGSCALFLVLFCIQYNFVDVFSLGFFIFIRICPPDTHSGLFCLCVQHTYRSVEANV